jgi:hypothetical protein
MMLGFLTDWWQSINWELKAFYAIAIPATIILVLQTILTAFGGDADDIPDADGDGSIHDDSGLGLISARTVIPFLAGFGWTGVICLKNGLGMLLTMPIALAVGAALMAGVYGIMRALWGLRETGTIDYANAVGEVGTVYLPVPPGREGAGQVEVMVQGRLMVVEAFTESPERLENRSRVRVVENLGSNSLLVKPLAEEGTART